uniref:Uncharacterized protein n=1 Tax=Ditylenchus dipsaci TaxID=166011 RepID=A0A915EDF3_9BILA
MFERTLANKDRTNDFAEAAHRRLHDALGVDHRTVGHLLQDLKRIQRSHDMHFEQYLAESQLPRNEESTMKQIQEYCPKYTNIVVV